MINAATIRATATAVVGSLDNAMALIAQGDAALPFAAQQLDLAFTNLSGITGHAAQVVIGPRVNVATEAWGIVSHARTLASQGKLPSLPQLVDARRAVERIGISLAS